MPVRLLTLAVLTATLLSAFPPAGQADPWIGVRGNHLVDRSGRTVRLLGVNRSGTEYQCERGAGIFEGPDDDASIAAMLSWRINVVRVPLNESCWLGINWIAERARGAAYRAAIHAYVERLERAGLYVILDLHWASPGTYPSAGIIPMPDADHSLDFWRSVATEYREDRSVIFDLYNEPARRALGCWEEGCEIEDQWVGLYQAVGMRQLVETVRSTGAQQPLMLGGVDWARDLGGWLSHRPRRPGARPRRLQPHLRLLALHGQLPGDAGADRQALPGRYRRAGRGRLPPPLHRRLHELGRPHTASPTWAGPGIPATAGPAKAARA